MMIALSAREGGFPVPVIEVAIVGDYDPVSPTHVATDAALEHAARRIGVKVRSTWIPTPELDAGAEQRLSGYGAVWCAPGSPYRSLKGALNAILAARTTGTAFIGTCGGFQHLVLEYAQNVLGIEDASLAEYNPYSSRLFITALACSLVGKTMQVRINPASRAFQAYGCETAEEHYYCKFGLNQQYRAQLHDAGLRVVGTDQDGEARIVELPTHRFFMGTLFVPQTSSTFDHPHPLIVAYLQAALKE